LRKQKTMGKEIYQLEKEDKDDFLIEEARPTEGNEGPEHHNLHKLNEQEEFDMEYELYMHKKKIVLNKAKIRFESEGDVMEFRR